MMRARFALALALVCTMAAIATAPLSPAGAAPDPLAWVGDNPLVSPVYAQSGQQPVTPEPDVVEEPVQGPPEPDVVEEPVQGPPEPDVVEEPASLGDFWGELQAAITSEASNAVTVGAAADALETARRNLIEAEQGHAVAMEGQGEHNAGVRAAAQRLVDFVTAAYLD